MRCFRVSVKSLKSDPREKPLDQSAIPLIAPSQLQPRLYQNIQNLGVLLIGSFEISNVSNALIGLQSQQAPDRVPGGLKVIKIKSKQSKHTSRTFRIGNIRCLYVRKIQIRQIAEVAGTFDGVEERSVELRESIVNHIQRRDILAVLPTGQIENYCCSSYYLSYGVGG